MNNIRALIFLLLSLTIVAALSFWALNQEAAQIFSSEDTGSGTHVIVDTMGREVAVKKDVEKIIAVPWPWTSFVFAVDGSSDKIAGMSATALLTRLPA